MFRNRKRILQRISLLEHVLGPLQVSLFRSFRVAVGVWRDEDAPLDLFLWLGGRVWGLGCDPDGQEDCLVSLHGAHRVQKVW